MTFQSAPLAIDGAQITASLIRRGTFASIGDSSGVVLSGDLKVSELDTPGVGVQIAPGVGLVPNDYQTIPNELYVVSNPGVHTVPSEEMPGSNASPKSYIVAVVIGDPDFSQTGHPFMGADDPPEGEEETFEYVRIVLVEVSAGATELTGDYPALPLARIDIPASTTTIIDSYIHDLTHLARPRQSQEIFVSASGTWDAVTFSRIASGSSYGNWGVTQFSPDVQVPSWAKRAIVVASINGVRLTDTSVNVGGGVRANLGGVNGPAAGLDFPVGTGAIRTNLQAGGEYDVSSIAGTEVALSIQGFENVPASPTNDQKLTLTNGSQIIFDVRFFEE